MSNSGISDFLTTGAWNSSFGFYYESAWLCFFEYEKTLDLITKEEQKLKSKEDISEEIIGDRPRFQHQEKRYILLPIISR